MTAPGNRGLTPNELAHARSTANLMLGPVPRDMPGGAVFFTRHDGQEIVAAVARRLFERLHPEQEA
jgi:hypothetical protein